MSLGPSPRILGEKEARKGGLGWAKAGEIKLLGHRSVAWVWVGQADLAAHGNTTERFTDLGKVKLQMVVWF